jgi:hypothetical protein
MAAQSRSNIQLQRLRPAAGSHLLQRWVRAAVRPDQAVAAELSVVHWVTKIPAVRPVRWTDATDATAPVSTVAVCALALPQPLIDPIPYEATLDLLRGAHKLPIPAPSKKSHDQIIVNSYGKLQPFQNLAE